MSLSTSDLRQTFRALWLQPMNSLLIVVVLALGMAGVIAMLSIIKSMVWDPLPYPNASQIVNVGWRDRTDIGDTDVDGITGGEYLQWKSQLKDVARIAGSGAGTINLTDKGVAERYDGAFVTHDLFSLLGVAPVLGRDFTAEDDAPGAPLTVIVSHSTWQTRFGGDPQILGRQIRANAQAATIIGVMPERFAFPRREQVWMAARAEPGLAPAKDRYLDVFLIPNPSVSWASVVTPIESWIAQAQKTDPTRWKQAEFFSQSMGMLFADPETRILLNLMLGTVVLVLLVACANGANLMLARTLASSRDLALRLTLGASRWQVSAYLLAQSIALTAIALAIAIPLAQLGIDGVLTGFAGTDSGPPVWMDFSVDLKMVAFSAIVALATSIFVGMVPVMRLRTDALGSALRDGGRAVAGSGLGKLSRAIVVGQLAIACIVLLATVVMVRGVDRIGKVDLGIDQTNLVTARVALFPDAYPEDADTLLFAERLTAKLRENPEVLAATAATILPGVLVGGERILPEGFDVGENAPPETALGSVDSSFAETYRIELRAGRFFEARDTATSDPVMVIDQVFADQIFPGADPIGKRVKMPPEGEDSRWHTVIGVTEPLQQLHADDGPVPATLVAMSQHPARFVSIAVRTRGESGAFKSQFLSALRQIDPDTPAYWLRTYGEVVSTSLAGDRVLSAMFSAFGSVALILAAAGLYGLIAQLVGQRTREIGVQRALGASGFSVLRGLLRGTIWQIGLGLGIGIAIAVPFAKFLVVEALPGLSVEVPEIVALVLTLLGVACIATLVPARRALTVDPMVALRNE